MPDTRPATATCWQPVARVELRLVSMESGSKGIINGDKSGELSRSG